MPRHTDAAETGRGHAVAGNRTSVGSADSVAVPTDVLETGPKDASSLAVADPQLPGLLLIFMGFPGC